MRRYHYQKSTKGKKSKNSYNKYNFAKRIQLIKRVKQNNEKVSVCAKDLEICPTTARLIISTWENEGRIFQKKSEMNRRLKKQAKDKLKNESNLQISSINLEVIPNISNLQLKEPTENSTPDSLNNKIVYTGYQSVVQEPGNAHQQFQILPNIQNNQSNIAFWYIVPSINWGPLYYCQQMQ